MKKKLAAIAAAALMLLLCACDVNTASPAPSQSPAQDQTGQTSPEPETTPETPYEEAGKKLIEGFEQGEISELVQSLDWTSTGYGISNPKLSVTDNKDMCDQGKGMLTVLPDANAWCQSYTFKGESVSKAFSQGGSYLRLWVCNKTGGTLGVGMVAAANGKQAYFSAEDAVLTGADGTVLKAETGDPSGMGQGKPSAVIIPDGFCGWLSFRCDKLGRYWENAMLEDIKTTESLNIDVRPASFSDEGSYVFDELALTENMSGQLRDWEHKQEDDKNMTNEEKIAKGFEKAINTTPVLNEIAELNPTGTYSGIKAVWYEGMTKNGRKTKVFAYVGFPENADASSPVPAIVLVHGGGGHAFLPWVKMWNERGYAAIAMDNTGYFPTAVNAGSSETDTTWRYGLMKSLKEEGYTNAPNNDGMGSSAGKAENMWMYHAVGQTILAANALRADSRVAADKVGVTGISWGGVISSITIGWDNRFAFAVPVYGSGYLDESLAWMKNNFSGKETIQLWSAKDRFDKADMPILWLCWNDDSCFSVNSNSKSYLDTVKVNPADRLSMINKMYHSHGCGWNPGEIMMFADSVVKGGATLTGFASQPSGRKINVKIEADSAASKVTAKLYYITEDMTYSRHKKYGYEDTFMDQEWQTADLTVKEGTVTGSVPAKAKGYYIELTTEIAGKSYVTCSVYTVVK